MKPGDIARKAQFLNMKEDGMKIRSTRIESKKNYKRKPKHASKGWD